jgi:molybdopterin molybdotransferase
MSQEYKTKSLSVLDAKEKILAEIKSVDIESIRIIRAGGRILAQSIIAPIDLPPFANSSMDGFAIISADVGNASLENPTILKVVADIPAGKNSTQVIATGQAARIMTGAVIPPGADAVIPVEYTDQFQDNKQFNFEFQDSVRIFKSVSKGDYIRPQGQDLLKGNTILNSGRTLKPQDIGVLAMMGFPEVNVFRYPKIAILSTGDELVSVDKPLQIGRIHDSNSYTLTSQIIRDGGKPYYLGIAKDRFESVNKLLEQAISLGVDLIISSAGVSVGAFDFVREVVEQNGHLGFWKVNIRPGRPLVFGHFRGTPFIGLPGNPVSAFVCYEVFIRPTIQKLSGRKDQLRETFRVTLAEQIESDGRESYLRGYVKKRAGILEARLTGHQGSGNLLSLVQANALLIIPSEVKSLPSGAEVDAWILGDLSEDD